MKIVVVLFAAFVTFAAMPARAADAPTADDTAKFLAGMPVSPDSPLAPLAQSAGYKAQARAFDRAFASFNKRQGSKIATWSEKNLTNPKPTLLYTFSGPDFLYANAFFPKATTYVLAALEPTGAIPDVTKVRPSTIPYELAQLRQSMSSLLSISFFITHIMRSELNRGHFRGTLPVLYVFLARTGHTIDDVSLVYIDTDGTLKTDAEGRRKSNAKGVKITMTDKNGRDQTLYYFSTNIGNGSLKKSGFLTFCEGLGDADAFIKSASYLPHLGGFSTIRDFLLKQSSTIVEDDSGIPLSYFKSDQWRLEPFGNYVGPIPIFSQYYQPRLRRLFVKDKSPRLDFGIGYRHIASQSSLLVAVKKVTAAAQR